LAPETEVHLVDARGLLCPLPVIRTQDAAKRLGQGAVIEILATDPGTLHDLPAWCRVHGHDLIMAGEEEGNPDSAATRREVIHLGAHSAPFRHFAPLMSISKRSLTPFQLNSLRYTVAR
jgi:tRNA 2-thiouridine synthesizing protein A